MSTRRRLVVFNAGSSSLKVEQLVLDGGWRSDLRAIVDGVGGERATLRVGGGEPEPLGAVAAQRDAAELVLERFGALSSSDAEVVATGHRLVHGGDVFAAPELVTESVRERLEALSPLAPLHNPPALEVLDAVQRRFRGAPAVAVFDTAFFRGLPAHASTYAIPTAWRRGGAVRRYGFHGLAHECLYRGYRALAGASGRADRVVTLQLGRGCSAAALLRGEPVETSMGYTPLEGLIMGTRPGDVDAGILLELVRAGLSPAALENGLNRESGLLALSERSADVRDLLGLEAAGDARAALALHAFCHRIRKYVGAYAAVLGGLDAVVFGGGVGENAPEIRRRVCAGFEWLGLELDERANAACRGRTAAIGAAGAAVSTAVVEVREERAIARHVCERLGIETAGL